MNAEHGVDDVLRAVAAGAPVDWSAAESTAADDSARSVIRELKVIAGIAALHRTLHDTPGYDWDADEPAVESWGGLTLLERAGRGAFGDVYRAWDRRLDREVALKLLRHRDEQRDADSAVIDEGRLLARVRHANVVTVHGADRIEGRVGLWMEFIHGRTLEQVLQKDGPFGAREAVLIGLDVCRGLSAVHRAGLVHRDVKAQNVMREDGGRIVLMDFGAGQPSDDVAGGDLAGTPLYLAPEVLEGTSATAQADLYSVGVLLYHLVTGSYPVRGATWRDVREAHQQRRTTLLRDVRPDLPETFVQVVERALAADPSERYQSAGALEVALSRAMDSDAQPSSEADATHAIEKQRSASRARWFPRRVVMATVAGVAALALAGTVAWNWNGQKVTRPQLAFQARDWILLVPFENRSGDASLDGVIEAALEHELVNSRFVNVVPRVRVDDALRLMNRPIDVRLDPAVAREVCLRDGAIRAFVTGRVEKIGSTYALTASLADASDGRAVASVVEEASFGQLPRAVRRLSNRVRETLGESRALIRQTNERLEKVTTPSLRALRLYTESYALGDRGQWPAALELVKQAVSQDPEFGSAQIWLAWALLRNRRPTAEYLPVAARAMELVDRTTDAERNWIAGSYHLMRHEYEEAAAAYEVLLGLHPDHRWAMNNLIVAHNNLRRDSTALVVRQADAQPNNPRVNMAAATALTRIKDFDRARPYLERVKTLTTGPNLDPNLAIPVAAVSLFRAYKAFYERDVWSGLAALHQVAGELNQMPPAVAEALATQYLPAHYLALGRTNDARRVVSTIGDSTDRHLRLALIGFLAGDLRETRSELAQLRVKTIDVSPIHPDQWYIAAWLFARADRFAEADAIIEEHSDEPTVNALRGDLALARGEVRRAVSLLRSVLDEPSSSFTGSGPAYRSVERLADAFVRQGRPDEAAHALQMALAWRSAEAVNNLPTAPYWMRLELKLAELDHELGRHEEARALEDDLTKLLAAADPDFPLMVKLQRLLAQRGK